MYFSDHCNVLFTKAVSLEKADRGSKGVVQETISRRWGGSQNSKLSSNHRRNPGQDVIPLGRAYTQGNVLQCEISTLLCVKEKLYYWHSKNSAVVPFHASHHNGTNTTMGPNRLSFFSDRSEACSSFFLSCLDSGTVVTSLVCRLLEMPSRCARVCWSANAG